MNHRTRALTGFTLFLGLVLVLSPSTSSRILASGDTSADAIVKSQVESRWQADFEAMRNFRPGFEFWQHIFTIPDGSIAFGSATTGQLLAVFPVQGDWHQQAVWKEPTLSSTIAGETLPRDLNDRRTQVALLMEAKAGPLVHNPTRGRFLLPNVRRYGPFLREWGLIYERFGVPADLGLAQAAIESGLDGTKRSEAKAVGFCQWLESNWKRLDRLASDTIEGRNQTTQAPYCAAYLAILATKYGSFIPALSEHHSGGTNVGRTLINGTRLGGMDVRAQYFMGSQLARDLRQISLDGYRDVYRTYGPRSYYYAEMVFGNMATVRNLTEATPQKRIFAMRTPRSLSLTQIVRQSGLSADEVRRYNPALVRQVPSNATLYLPSYIRQFGRDVTFWHRAANPAFSTVLSEFLRLPAGADRWDNPNFEPVLRGFQRRFGATRSEEGAIMATVLAYAIDETYSSPRRAILTEFRNDPDVLRLFKRGVIERRTFEGLASSVRACTDGTTDDEIESRPGC